MLADSAWVTHPYAVNIMRPALLGHALLARQEMEVTCWERLHVWEVSPTHSHCTLVKLGAKLTQRPRRDGVLSETASQFLPVANKTFQPPRIEVSEVLVQ